MTQEFVTLPREVVELALNAFVKLQADDDVGLASWDFAEAGDACFALRAALDQPQNHIPGVRNMAPAGWKLVPVEPTDAMLDAVRTKGGPQAVGYAIAAWLDLLEAAPQYKGGAK